MCTFCMCGCVCACVHVCLHVCEVGPGRCVEYISGAQLIIGADEVLLWRDVTLRLWLLINFSKWPLICQ